MALGVNTPWLARLIGLALASRPAAPGGRLGRRAALMPRRRAPSSARCEADELRSRQARASIRCFLNRERAQRGLSTPRQRPAPPEGGPEAHRGHAARRTASRISARARARSRPACAASTISSAACCAGPTARTSPGAASISGRPKAMVKAWMNSPGHKANILNPARSGTSAWASSRASRAASAPRAGCTRPTSACACSAERPGRPSHRPKLGADAPARGGVHASGRCRAARR